MNVEGHQKPTTICWCLGMYASGSTWLYNVVRQLYLSSSQTQLQTHFISGKTNLDAFDRSNSSHIVKSHEISDGPTIEGLAQRSTHMLVTIRDPRDAVTSLMLYHGHSFERALPLVEAAMTLCLYYASDQKTQLWHYENGFYDDPLTLEHVAEHLKINLSKAIRDNIFLSLRRSEVDKFISSLDRVPGVLQDRISGDRLDPQTHWHTHHAGRSGEVGRWKHMLTPAQIKDVELRVKGYFTYLEQQNNVSEMS